MSAAEAIEGTWPALQPPPRRVLVRAPNWTGDFAMATPGFRALRAAFPDAHLTLHVREALLPLAHGAPWFDALLPLRAWHAGPRAWWREARRLRAGRFDLGVCLPDSFSSALLMRLGGVGRVVGMARGGRRPLLTRAVAPPGGLVARERHVLAVVAAAGAAPRGTHLELFTTAEEERVAGEQLAKAGVPADAPLALLAPGASYGPSKLWPAREFAQLGDALAARGLAVAVVGTPAEAPLVASVAAAMARPAAALAGALDLGALKAVVRRARLLVCNDAGARHLAVAFGVPCVVLMGPTALEKTDMNLERVSVLSADVSCRPCYLRECPIDHRCLTRIPAQAVLEELEPVLAGGPLRGRRRRLPGDGAPAA